MDGYGDAGADGYGTDGKQRRAELDDTTAETRLTGDGWWQCNVRIISCNANVACNACKAVVPGDVRGAEMKRCALCVVRCAS